MATWTVLAPGKYNYTLTTKYHETFEKFGPTNVLGNKNNTTKNTKAKKLIYNGSWWWERAETITRTKKRLRTRN
jgi:hypothetical protein